MWRYSNNGVWRFGIADGLLTPKEYPALGAGLAISAALLAMRVYPDVQVRDQIRQAGYHVDDDTTDRKIQKKIKLWLVAKLSFMSLSLRLISKVGLLRWLHMGSSSLFSSSLPLEDSKVSCLLLLLFSVPSIRSVTSVVERLSRSSSLSVVVSNCVLFVRASLYADAHRGFLVEAKFQVTYLYGVLFWKSLQAWLDSVRDKVLFRKPPQAYLHLGKGSIVSKASSGSTSWGEGIILEASLGLSSFRGICSLELASMLAGVCSVLAQPNTPWLSAFVGLIWLVRSDRWRANSSTVMPGWTLSSLPFFPFVGARMEQFLGTWFPLANPCMPQLHFQGTRVSPLFSGCALFAPTSIVAVLQMHRVKKKKRKLGYIYFSKAFQKGYANGFWKNGWSSFYSAIVSDQVTLVVGIPNDPDPKFCSAPLVGFPPEGKVLFGLPARRVWQLLIEKSFVRRFDVDAILLMTFLYSSLLI
ncbi:hypothetical protein Fmac_020635 [Flemingia macrophylla]|uniref:Uncharacterized protein n=1 Tax=Flemingia macrophylla TaxID=520843 RepID=A0ABD1LUJ5_9FABA